MSKELFPFCRDREAVILSQKHLFRSPKEPSWHNWKSRPVGCFHFFFTIWKEHQNGQSDRDSPTTTGLHSQTSPTTSSMAVRFPPLLGPACPSLLAHVPYISPHLHLQPLLEVPPPHPRRIQDKKSRHRRRSTPLYNPSANHTNSLRPMARLRTRSRRLLRERGI